MSKNKPKYKKHDPSKAEKAPIVWNCFNLRAPKSSAEATFKAIEEAAREYGLTVWSTVYEYLKPLESSWDYSDPYFKRWWLDRIVDEFSHMVWIHVFNSAYYEDGEKKASKKADLTKTEFCNKFK